MRSSFPVIFLAILLFIAPASVRAQAPILFFAPDDDLRVRQVISFLSQTNNLSARAQEITIARMDLNGDGVHEYIIRQTSAGCAASATCLFHVVGVHDNDPKLLGFFRGRKIGMGLENHYGVQDILVYNDKSNDFSATTYRWDPKNSAFIPP